jgi:hypothetical protein
MEISFLKKSHQDNLAFKTNFSLVLIKILFFASVFTEISSLNLRES